MKKKGCLTIIIIFFIIGIGISSILKIGGKLGDDKEKIALNEKLLSKITVECKVMKSENNETVTAVTVRNNSDKLFKGVITVFLKNGEKSKDISDLNIELAPNTGVVKNIICKELKKPNYSYKIKGDFEKVNYYSSKYNHQVIFEQDGGTLKQLYILVDKIDKTQLNDIVKEYKDKYKNKLSCIKFFDKSQKVKIGENPYSNNIDEKAEYTIGNNKLNIY